MVIMELTETAILPSESKTGLMNIDNMQVRTQGSERPLRTTTVRMPKIDL